MDYSLDLHTYRVSYMVSGADKMDKKSMEVSCVLKTHDSPRAFMPTPAVLSTLCKPVPVPCSPPAEPAGQSVLPVLKSAPKQTSPPEASLESEEEKAKKLLYCSLCKVAVNSLSQLEAHNTDCHGVTQNGSGSSSVTSPALVSVETPNESVCGGTVVSTKMGGLLSHAQKTWCPSTSTPTAPSAGSKHKTMLEARNGAGPIKAYPRPGSKLKMQANVLKGSGLQNKTFHCEICDVHVNSEIQLKQHISSRRHKDRVAGKPLKPKYSPYNKQQRSSSALAAKLALQKDLVKPISPAFISTPFSPTTMPSISLHARPNASIFQTATLQASFLRAAPGPIRPSTSSILFAPY
ncbi:hypothetical protein NFI96_007788 [Prochilodus magdalenae]|nr:hypothetical protein NFI96_007788 [Prochilodus magdalenae]